MTAPEVVRAAEAVADVARKQMARAGERLEEIRMKIPDLEADVDFALITLVRNLKGGTI